MYKVYLNNKDFSDYVSNLNWNDSIETLATEVSFDLATNRHDNNFKDAREVTLGATFQLLGRDGVIVEGIVVAEDVGDKITSFTVYDFAWYLNKSTVIKQFKKLNGNECIKKLCEELGVPAQVEGLESTIDKIYRDKKVSDVIRDIIKQCEAHSNKSFYLRFEDGTLKVGPFEKVVVNGEFELSPGSFIKVNDFVGEVNLSRNILELKNSVLVVSKDKAATRVEGAAQDEGSIEKYGKLQEVIELDEQMFGKAELVAKNELKKLNRIAEDFSITVLGDDKLRAGKVIELDVPLFNLKGDYLIKESSHSLDGLIHKAILTLEVYIYG